VAFFFIFFLNFGVRNVATLSMFFRIREQLGLIVLIKRKSFRLSNSFTFLEMFD
jgi:hypothetical protein